MYRICLDVQIKYVVSGGRVEAMVTIFLGTWLGFEKLAHQIDIR